MERIRSFCARRYRHDCPVRYNPFQQMQTEICPDCGQKGEFAGFFQGMYTRIGRQSGLLGFPGIGAHRRFLPKLIRTCERCNGEGIALGEDFDYECPDCSGTGGFLSCSDEEIR